MTPRPIIALGIASILSACNGPDICSVEGRQAAYEASQQFAARRLVAPVTASFPPFGEHGMAVVYNGECSFRVVGLVDAQNSFGALIRTRYLVDMEYNPDRGTWSAFDRHMLPTQN